MDETNEYEIDNGDGSVDWANFSWVWDEWQEIYAAQEQEMHGFALPCFNMHSLEANPRPQLVSGIQLAD